MTERGSLDSPVGRAPRSDASAGSFDGPVGSPREARGVVRREIEREGWHGDRDVAVLLASELAANALVHGGGSCRLRVVVDRSCLRVSASDPVPSMPVLREPGPRVPSGRGLFLVDRLATSWGVRPSATGGKSVWFSLEEVPPTR